MVKMKASQMYRRYCTQHSEEKDRASTIYYSWQAKHSQYDYIDTLKRFDTKRLLIALFYRFEIKDFSCYVDNLSSSVESHVFNQNEITHLHKQLSETRESIHSRDKDERRLFSQFSSPSYCQTSFVASDCFDAKKSILNDEISAPGLTRQSSHSEDRLRNACKSKRIAHRPRCFRQLWEGNRWFLWRKFRIIERIRSSSDFVSFRFERIHVETNQDKTRWV